LCYTNFDNHNSKTAKAPDARGDWAMRRFVLPFAAAMLLGGCALAPTYDSKVGAPLAVAAQGNVDEALRALDAKAKDTDKADLLLNLERGELLRITARFQDSQAAFETADVKVNLWEATARSDPEKLIGQISATFFGDTFRAYEGQDYEKVMLTTRMAMNRISLGDLDTARVDVKRTHEREAVIAEFRAKETAAAEKEAKDKGVTGEAKELNGYPIETLNDPEVLLLKNGYQNALSHYLAGFVYEALNEPSLAAPGYRHAIELRPGLPILEEGLRGLDQRTSFRRPKGLTDVLFVIETGNAPARKSQQITFPIPSRNGLIIVPIAFPVIHPNHSAVAITEISVGDKMLPTALITDFNVMARRALKDELPGMQLRAAIRAIGKGVIQEQLNRKGGWIGVVGNIAAVATESPADDRMWRALPERVFVARSFIAPGTYNVRVPGGEVQLKVEGRHMLVPLRMLQTRTYFAQPSHFGNAGQMAAVEPVPPSPSPAAKTPAKTPAKGTQRSASASGTGSAKGDAKAKAEPGAAPATAGAAKAKSATAPTTPPGSAKKAAEPGKTSPPANTRTPATESATASPPAAANAVAGSASKTQEGTKPKAASGSSAAVKPSGANESPAKPAPGVQ
jgi:hypothetical protein